MEIGEYREFQYPSQTFRLVKEAGRPNPRPYLARVNSLNETYWELVQGEYCTDLDVSPVLLGEVRNTESYVTITKDKLRLVITPTCVALEHLVEGPFGPAWHPALHVSADDWLPPPGLPTIQDRKVQIP